MQINITTGNITGDGRQQRAVQQPLCSSYLTSRLHRHLTLLSVLNSFLSFTAFLGNALILIALRKESSLHPPSKLLLRSLATTDFGVGLCSEPLTVIYWMSEVNEDRNICPLALSASTMTGSILNSVSLLTLTAISVDRLLALQYRQGAVTLKRTYVVVSTIWIVSTVFTAMRYWNPLISLWYWIILIPLSLVTSMFSYTKIFLNLRHHQNQVQDHVQQPNQTNQLNIARYKKAVFTAIWLQLTLVACYLPYFVVVALLTNGELSSSVYQAWVYAHSLVYLNSSLNPILYFWKVEEVSQAVKDTIRQVLCHWFLT